MYIPKLPSRAVNFMKVFLIVPIAIGIVGLIVWGMAWLLENGYWPLLVLIIWMAMAWVVSGDIEREKKEGHGGKRAP